MKELRRRQDEEEDRRRQEEIARHSADKPDGADRRSETGSIKSGRKYLYLINTLIFSPRYISVWIFVDKLIGWFDAKKFARKFKWLRNAMRWILVSNFSFLYHSLWKFCQIAYIILNLFLTNLLTKGQQEPLVRKSSQPKQPPAAAEAPAPAVPEQPAPAGAAAVVSPSPITSPEVGTDSEAAKGNIFLTNL